MLMTATVDQSEKCLRIRLHFPFAEPDCFPAVLSDGRDASPDLLHHYYNYSVHAEEV